MCEVAEIEKKGGVGQLRVLVNGGSGSVGSMACQIAREKGAGWVVATCSGGNVGMVKGLGVDEVREIFFSGWVGSSQTGRRCGDGWIVDIWVRLLISNRCR